MKTACLIFTGPGVVNLGETEIPEPIASELLIETEVTCVSPGTEGRCLAGTQPGAVFPFIPGYSLVGRVLKGGAATKTPPGTRVFCSGTQRSSVARTWGGHVAHAVVEERSVFPVPSALGPLDVAAAKLAAISYHGFRLSRPQLHERIAVVGLGVIGQLSARIHALSGARVLGIDRAAKRVEQARAIGLEAVVAEGGDLEALVRDHLGGSADLVVDSTGVPAVLGQAAGACAKPEWNDDPPPRGSRLLVQGSYPGDISLDYHLAFHRELTVLFPRDQQPRDLIAVLDLVGRGRLSLRDLISWEGPPAEAQGIYDALRTPGSEMLTAAFRWRE